MSPSSQVRTNALTSYFFLGFLFLMARGNPNFSDPFVQEHAKSATKIHLLFVGYLILHEYLIAPLLGYEIPVVSMNLARIALIGAFALVFAALIRGAVRAYRGEGALGIFALFWKKESSSARLEIRGETELVRTMLSFVPLIGPFVSERLRTPLTSLGVRISGVFTTIFLLLFVFNRGESVLLSLLFGYIVLFVAVAAFLGLGKSPEFLTAFASIPSLERLAQIVRTLPRYFADVALAAIGKTDRLSFSGRLAERIEREAKADDELRNYFIEDSGAFSPYLAYVPVLNFLFLYRFFFPGKSRLVVAIGQGIVLSLIFIGLVFLYGPFDPILSLALLPISIGFATVTVRPFYRIPVLYELSALLSFLSFGLVSGTRAVHARSREEKEVRYTV